MSNSMKLGMLGLPQIFHTDDLSSATHVSKAALFRLSKYADRHYKTFEIDKKNGSKRLIAQPSRELKGLQSWVLVNILNRLHVADACKGFQKGATTLSNATPHIGANVVLTMDIENFFPSVHANRVYGIFHGIGYNSKISTILTNICTFNGWLPQGAPSSPRLANLALLHFDFRIERFVSRRGIAYTRYADDLTFSGQSPQKVSKLIPVVTSIIQSEGFEVNSAKTRIAGTSACKKVTGLVVREQSVGIGRKKYRELRSMLFNHYSAPSTGKAALSLEQISGWMAYVKSVDAESLRRLTKYREELAAKFTVPVAGKSKYKKPTRS